MLTHFLGTYLDLYNLSCTMACGRLFNPLFETYITFFNDWCDHNLIGFWVWEVCKEKSRPEVYSICNMQQDTNMIPE